VGVEDVCGNVSKICERCRYTGCTWYTNGCGGCLSKCGEGLRGIRYRCVWYARVGEVYEVCEWVSKMCGGMFRKYARGNPYQCARCVSARCVSSVVGLV
jgi:hypothetical protein